MGAPVTRSTPLTEQRPTTGYQQLVQKTQPPPTEPQTAESELDTLVQLMTRRKEAEKANTSKPATDPIDLLRELTVKEFIPIFVELVEKYAKAGINLEMDASNLLQGGRELKFEFNAGEYRSVLQGTATTEGIAFHETRYAPDIQGELTSGPMLRLRGLDGKIFREFVCARLSLLMRTSMRRR